MTPSKEKVHDALSNLTHYSRSKFSRDCSRSETEEEMSTEMLVASEVEALMTSELSRVEKETENRVWREAGEMALQKKIDLNYQPDMQDLQSVARFSADAGYCEACKDISSTLLSQVKE